MVTRSKVSDDVEMGSERGFAIVFAAFFAIIAALPLLHGQTPRLWAVGVATIFLIIGLVRPILLRPLNILWFRLSLLLGKIVTPIVMGLIYVIAFIPIGIVLRLCGKDVLALKRRTDRESYWIIRQPPGPEAGSMKRQF